MFEKNPDKIKVLQTYNESNLIIHLFETRQYE